MWIKGIAGAGSIASNAMWPRFEAISAAPQPAAARASIAAPKTRPTAVYSPSPRRRMTVPPSTLSMMTRGCVPSGRRRRQVAPSDR